MADKVALATAAEAERSLTPFRAVRIYRKAFAWCLFASLGSLLWGYDSQIGGGLLSVPAFRRDFGHPFDQGQYVIPARWQSAFNSVSSVGGMFGGLGMGWIADRLGRRATIALACVISIIAVVLQSFCPPHANAMLLVGKLINGVGLGMFVSSAAGYCSEISPLPLRGVTTGGVNLWIVLGQFVSNCVIEGTGNRTDKYAYRIPFAIQWAFPILLLAGLPFAPESPWYLVRKGDIDSARQVLARLGGSRHTDRYTSVFVAAHTLDLDLQLRQIQETITLEDAYARQSTYLDCFRGVNRRRTFIALMVFVLQQGAGVVFVLGFSTYFFQLAGFDVANSFKLGVGVTAIGVVGNLLAMYMINAYGRRQLFINGMTWCALTNLAIGACSIPNNVVTRWAAAVLASDLLSSLLVSSTPVMTIVYNFAYQASIGPLGYVLFAEVGSAKLRSKTVGIGICVNSLCGMVMNIVIPYLVNPDEANLGGKVGFIFAALALVGAFWSTLFIPETKHRTVDELDALFEAHIGARDFGWKHLTVNETETEHRSNAGGVGEGEGHTRPSG